MFKNCFTLNNKLLVVALLAGIQLGCADGDGNLSDSIENIDTTTSADSGTTASASLDCSNLDPNKVYLHGTLIEGSAEKDAIIDPAQPTVFCMGFLSGYRGGGHVSDSGRYIYEHSLTIYSMEPEPFDKDALDNDVYPADPLANDTALHTSSATSCGIGVIMINSANGIIYYTCGDITIYTDSTSPYYSLGNGDLLSVLDDGSMLIGEFSTLKIVDTSLVETTITTPAAAFPEYLTARLFTDPVTSNPSVWVVVEDGSNSLQRWSVDLVTLVATDDGNFSAVPANVTDLTSFGKLKLDGDGNLWQMGRDTSTGTLPDVIIKRPMSSSSEPASVVYTETDDDGSAEYFVKAHASYLFTGL